MGGSLEYLSGLGSAGMEVQIIADAETVGLAPQLAGELV